jgi:hypothetical protein
VVVPGYLKNRHNPFIPLLPLLLPQLSPAGSGCAG